MREKQRDKQRRRFDRQFERLGRYLPGVAKLRSPGWAIGRIFAALLLIVGGTLGMLPVLGFWMIPLGLLLLAIDIPALQAPLSAAIIRSRRRLTLLRRKWRS